MSQRVNDKMGLVIFFPVENDLGTTRDDIMTFIYNKKKKKK